MRLESCRFLVAILVAAIAPIGAYPGYAQTAPPVESTAPGISTPIPAPPPSATVPHAAPPNSETVMTQPPASASEETLADCVSFWDPETHMSKTEWQQTCKRTLNGRIF
jgi:hypothetical protein